MHPLLLVDMLCLSRRSTVYRTGPSLCRSARRKGSLSGNHWGIEGMHWSLDVVLKEDKRTVRKDNGAQNLAVLKRMALNILRANASEDKMTGPQKRFRACWDETYMGSVLRNM